MSVNLDSVPCLGDAEECLAFDADNGGNVLVPFAALKGVADGKDLGRACLKAGPSWLILHRDGACRCGGGGDGLGCFKQGRLVSFDLRDQGALCVTGGRERFFWQFMASAVANSPASPRSASRRWAAGIPLLLSSISGWPRMMAVSVAKALRM